jgi:IclR family pca regulon transcriptional regulator
MFYVMKQSFTSASLTTTTAKRHPPAETYGTRALERGLGLLGCFSAWRPKLSPAELANAAGFDEATALRLLRGLEHLDFIERLSDDPRYRLGLKALELVAAYHSSHLLIQITEPHLQQLAPRSGITLDASSPP